MTRTVTGLCVAAAFGCIATLGAQTSSTATTAGQPTATSDKNRDITITGCLSKAADGKYMLTNARMDNPMSGTQAGGTSTSTGTSTAGTSSAAGTTAAGTTAGTSTATSTTAGHMAAMNHPAATAWMLSGGSDLDKHLGHKIQVTGRTGWDNNAMDHSRMPDTASAAGTAATTTVGTSGSTATAGTEEPRKDMQPDQPRLDVQSIKMIASSCS